MIDTTQLSELISAFRVETEKESISPETVGKLLQDILDLLATASTDAERQVLDSWKNLISQFYVVYDIAHATGMADMEHMYLTMRSRSMRNGATFNSHVPLSGATDTQAGVMTAAHVQALMALQASLPQVRSAVSDMGITVRQHSSLIFNIQSAGSVVTDIRQGAGNATKILLSLTKHDVRTGEDFPGLGTCQIAAATATQAGAMTAAQVTALNNAKTDITALQAKMRTVQGAGTLINGAQVFHIALDRVGIMLFGYDLATGEREIEHQSFYLTAASRYAAGVMTAAHVKQLEDLRKAVFDGGIKAQSGLAPLAIEINNGNQPLRLRGADSLLDMGYTPYLFRYTRKRNRNTDQDGKKRHGKLRKGWNVLGKHDTLRILNDGQVAIRKDAVKHPLIDEEEFERLELYQTEANFFVSERDRFETKYVPYGATKVYLTIYGEDDEEKNRKVRLQYGIAFADYEVGKRGRLDISRLVTPIVPFYVCTRYNKSSREREWIFER